MSDISEIKAEFSYLKQVRGLLGPHIQIDNLRRVDKFFLDAKLDSKFVYDWIENTYYSCYFQQKTLPKNFGQISTDYVESLDKRICKIGLYLLLNKIAITPEHSWASKANEVKDIWISNLRSGNDDSEKLLKASTHTWDILFACEVALNQISEKSKTFAENELSPFINDYLPLYLQLLPSGSSQLQEKLVEDFEQLNRDISLDNLGDAKKRLDTIQKSLLNL